MSPGFDTLSGALPLGFGRVPFPIAALGVSDPTTWGTSDWLSDPIPHPARGIVTAIAYVAVMRDLPSPFPPWDNAPLENARRRVV